LLSVIVLTIFWFCLWLILLWFFSCKQNYNFISLILDF
jgi:hypothetical protein